MEKYTAIGVVLLIVCLVSGVYAYTSWSKEKTSYNYVKIGLNEMEKGNYDKAIEYLEKAIEHDPNYAIAYYDLALAYGNEEQFHRYYKLPGETFVQAGYPEMQKKYEKAVKYLELLEQRFPENKPIAEQALGDVNFLYYCGYVNREKYVLPHYLYALNHADEVEKFLGKEGISALYTNLARTYLAMAEVKKAEEYYEKAIEIYPEPGVDSAYEHLAWVEIELGKIDNAYKVAKEFIEHAKKYGWDSDLGLAPAMISSYLLNKYDEAKSYAESTIERFPESAYVGEAYRILAMIYYQSGDYVKAVEMLKTDISKCDDAIKNPEDATTVPTAKYERGLAYYLLYLYTNESTYLDKAISDFEWIVKNPKQTKREVAHRNYYILSHLSLATVYSQKGEFDKAKQYISKLKSELSKDPDMQGWKAFIGQNVNKLAEDLENNRKIEMPDIGWIVSH